MNRQALLLCSWSVIFFFLFTLLSPDDASCFDTDALKTTGIIMGITFGVALVVVLLVGTIHDMKRDRDKGDEVDEVWSRHPLLRTLGYRPVDYPFFGGSPAPPEVLFEQGRMHLEKANVLPQGRIRTIGLAHPLPPSMQAHCLSTVDGMPDDLALWSPDTDPSRILCPISLWRTEDRS